MRGQFGVNIFLIIRLSQRDIAKEIRQLGGREPRHAGAVVDAAEDEPTIPFDAVPSQIGDLNPFARHGFHGIAEEGFDVSDFHGEFVAWGDYSVGESAHSGGRSHLPAVILTGAVFPAGHLPRVVDLLEILRSA